MNSSLTWNWPHTNEPPKDYSYFEELWHCGYFSDDDEFFQQEQNNESQKLMVWDIKKSETYKKLQEKYPQKLFLDEKYYKEQKEKNKIALDLKYFYVWQKYQYIMSKVNTQFWTKNYDLIYQIQNKNNKLNTRLMINNIMNVHTESFHEFADVMNLRLKETLALIGAFNKNESLKEFPLKNKEYQYEPPLYASNLKKNDDNHVKTNDNNDIKTNDDNDVKTNDDNDSDVEVIPNHVRCSCGKNGDRKNHIKVQNYNSDKDNKNNEKMFKLQNLQFYSDPAIKHTIAVTCYDIPKEFEILKTSKLKKFITFFKTEYELPIIAASGVTSNGKKKDLIRCLVFKSKPIQQLALTLSKQKKLIYQGKNINIIQWTSRTHKQYKPKQTSPELCFTNFNCYNWRDYFLIYDLDGTQIINRRLSLVNLSFICTSKCMNLF